MQKSLKYTIFKTEWGFFGFVVMDDSLCRTCLPLPEFEKVKSYLLNNLSQLNLGLRIQFDRRLFKILQEQITGYFEGVCINFSRDIPINLDRFGSFSRSVLTACMDMEFGRKTTYATLAKRLGRPSTSRAVGNILAKNPLPLIIPCHRVIRSDGKIGGFSAFGGVKVKERLLKHELTALTRSMKDSSNVVLIAACPEQSRRAEGKV